MAEKGKQKRGGNGATREARFGGVESENGRLRGWKGLTKGQKRNLYSVHASGWEGKRMTSEKARGWRYLCSVQVRPASAAENG